MVLLVYGIYSMALEPFTSAQEAGHHHLPLDCRNFGRSIAGSGAWSIHMLSRSCSMANFVGQMQQTASVLTLCLLLFVCFALKPLGLTYGSRAFGVSMGLGILATTQLLQSSWLPTSQAFNVYSIIYFYSGLGSHALRCPRMGRSYFALPEPERAMVLLPTTSPYFFWNKISEALGDSPGFVAVSGFTPESMAPGELAAMIEASQPRVEQMPAIMQPVAINR